MINSPFEEKKVVDIASNKEASAAYARLKAVLDNLNPGAGIIDNGDGSGRHANKTKTN